MRCNIPDGALKSIKTFAAEHGIERVILFGSRARGDNTERSDVDIAVCGGDFDGFSTDLQESADSLLCFDVVKYDDNISNELKHEIERDGIVIYEKA